ncbi:unnamed protein product [Knipowitschia caucasica]|uniref:Uncharacterized protein n=1 Tax=Knipowitschia caucasica TaxID=637954 RepID=A0AAV2LXC1_KNICA
MCVAKAVFFILVLLVFVVNSMGKRRCNYAEILGTYRGLIYVELQSLNVTSSDNTYKVRRLCPSVKAHHILGSIYDTTQWMRCQIGGKPSALSHVLESMEQVIIHNCSPDQWGGRLSCASVKKIKGMERKRIQLIKIMKALTICWQKLHSVFPAK